MSTPEQDMAARLTVAARAVTEEFSPDEVTAILRYQARDRTYELVAAVLRNPRAADELTEEQADLVDTIVRALSSATRRWRVPEPCACIEGNVASSESSEPRPE